MIIVSGAIVLVAVDVGVIVVLGFIIVIGDIIGIVLNWCHDCRHLF